MSTLPSGTNADSAMFQYDPVTGKTYKWNSTTKEYIEFSKSDDVVHKTGDESIAGQKIFNDGIIIKGFAFSPYRGDAQLAVSNELGGHALIALENHKVAGDEEAAVTYQAILSDGTTVVQTTAGYSRFLNNINTVGNYRTVYGVHLPDAFGDKNPLQIHSNNSIRLVGGNTQDLPWDDHPTDNTVEVGRSGFTGGKISIVRASGQPSMLGTVDLVLEGAPSGTNGVVFINAYQAGDIILNQGGGKTGIGKVPTEKLDVNGNIKTSSLSGTGERLVSADSNGLLKVSSFDPQARPIQDTSLTTNQSSSTLNAAYPSALVGQTVTARNVGTGMKYEKIDSTGGGTWVAWPISII